MTELLTEMGAKQETIARFLDEKVAFFEFVLSCDPALFLGLP